MSPAGWTLLAASVPAGAAVGGAWAGVARRIPDPRQPLFRLWPCSALGARPAPRGDVRRRPLVSRWDPAAVAGVALPVAAFLVTPGPGAGLAATVVGWLLLGIAVCDERTLAIPHVLWLAGAATGLLVAWQAAGWSGLALRLGSAVVLAGGLLTAAVAARALAGRTAVGSSDYGVVAFLGCVLGPWVTLDVLLLSGVIALGVATVRACRGEHRAPVLALAAGAGVAGLFLGTSGAAAGAAALEFAARKLARRGRTARPVPFGACLAVSTLCVLLGGAIPPSPASAAVQRDVVLRHLRPNIP